MKIQGAKRLEAIDAPSFSELFEAKKQYAQKTGQEVIDFSIGSSNIPPHPDLKNALSVDVKLKMYKFDEIKMLNFV